MIKKYSLSLLLFFCAFYFGFAQLATINFETAGAGYTPSTTFGTGNIDVFNRTNVAINGNSTFHWAAEDISGNPFITLDQIDVSGSSDFTLAIDLSYDNTNAWDSTDEFIVTYSIDGGTFQNLLAVQHINTDAFNNPAALDLDFDGNGDPGQELSITTFNTYSTSAIPLSGNSTLDIRLQFNTLTSNNEGILIDNIVVDGTPISTSDPDLSISGVPTDHGSECVGVPATTQQYTITNNGTLSAMGVTVASDDTQFVVSGLSSTIIAPSGTATYNVTFTPNSIGPKTATITVNSTTLTSNSPTSSLTGTGISVPIITNQPTNQAVLAPTAATFDVVATSVTSYQWEISTDGGTIWNNVSTGTGGTTPSYSTPATILAMNGYQYRCVLTNVCGSITSSTATLTVTSTADVVITEIMYNTPTPGNDYEWIEICNLNGMPEDVSNYTIEVNGIIRFTFPATTTIPANSCITILIGNDGSTTPECPFTPDYGAPAVTNLLPNGGATVELVASDTTTVVDVVAYDDADDNSTDGNGSSFHVIDATSDNSDTDTNWQGVLTGGSPGTNSLISPCTAPEIQLENSSGVDQVCGSFIINFGSQATGFDTDLTFDIDNDGASDLDVSSFALSGTNPGDFSILSPATPFTVTAGNTQTVTVRFTPTANGNRTATLTINSNDSDESACSVSLEGVGTTPAPDINVEGNIGTFPDISNGDTTPSGTDNTLFAAQFIGSSQAKSFRIQNIGTSDLTVTGVTVVGTNPGDFTVTMVPAGTVTPSNLTTFEITFSPLASGVRIADISIANDDEDPYVFRVQGTGNCVANAITITPTSGPEGTIVTVTGTNLTTANAWFNGLPATVNNISTTQMEVTVPPGATTGNLEIIDDLGCPGFEAFTVIDTVIGTCEGGSALSELFISEVTDATYGSLTYIEIYNATGANINLANYSIRIYANGNTGSFTSQALTGTINAGDTYIITTGTFGVLGNALCATTGGDGLLGDLVSSTLQGVNIGTGDDDYIGLYNTSILIDAFGVFGDDDWTSSTTLTGDRGYDFRRLNTATPLPTATFNTNQWNIIDWAGSGSSTCITTNDYSDIGVFDFSTGVPATITMEPTAPTSNCDLTATLNVSATEGFAGGNALAYQWYFSAPGDLGWMVVTNGALYSGATTSTLNILNTLTLNDYQYYCQVREDDNTCYQASIATQLIVQRTTWASGAWDNGAPDSNTIAVIDDLYETDNDGNINACHLIINSGVNRTLDVKNSTFVRVVNNVVNNGTLIVQTEGSFVQDGDNTSAGTFTNNGSGTSRVNKTTDTFDSSITGNYNYTYWSSPVVNADVITVFPNPHANRRYDYNAENYLDSTAEIGNNNGTTAGQDDIDDNGDDWQTATGTMNEGRGYAVTAVSPPMPGALYSDSASFIGDFNTGDILIDVFKNDAENNDHNWNFIGNPYPSAISAADFLATNTFIESNPAAPLQGAIFLWSQGSPANAGNNGNENWNFNQNDYAIINGIMGTAGGNGIAPDPYIPSGQGFFIAYDHAGAELSANGTIKRNEVRFTNSMRETANNGQFFEANDNSSENQRTSTSVNSDKLWINLTSDNGVFSQIGLGYVSGASDNYDSWYFDTPRNLSTSAHSILYTIIDDYDKKFAIQGKSPQSLTLDEVVPLGFFTSIIEPTIYRISIEQFEGIFMESNTIYLKDNLLNITHNLSDNDYAFTSEIGEFNDRFEIVFSETLSTGEDDLNTNTLLIIENNDGTVTFKVSDNHQMQSITIFDVLGRVVYKLNAQGQSEITFNLSNLSQATYVAKIELNNGNVITKKALKQK